MPKILLLIVLTLVSVTASCTSTGEFTPEAREAVKTTSETAAQVANIAGPTPIGQLAGLVSNVGLILLALEQSLRRRNAESAAIRQAEQRTPPN